MALSKVFIQRDFSEKFKIHKMIGKGSVARVYLVENMNIEKKYAVKAFSKEYLKKKSNGKSV